MVTLLKKKRMSSVAQLNNFESSSDLISKLDDDLKTKILQCLPLADAVKTSLLSRNWRHIWTRMQHLEFDLESKDGDINFHGIIDGVLSLHQGNLEQFTIFTPTHHCSGFGLLNLFFFCLATKRIQLIRIIAPTNAMERFYIPPSLFECGGLRHLCLWACELRLPQNFHCLNNLVTLELGYITFTSKDLAKFISRCPNLETLYLEDTIDNMCEPFILRAYNLKSFHFADNRTGMIILKDTPCLTLVTLSRKYNIRPACIEHKKLHTMFQLFCSMSAVEELSFDLLLREPLDGDCPIKLRKELVALKTLHIDELNICSQDDVLFTLCLLRSSPNLKTLNIYLKDIKLNGGDDEAYVEWLEVERGREYHFLHLENVKIANLLGLRGETMLVSTLLSRCPLLKTLCIELSSEIQVGKELEMVRELNCCPRLSKAVELVFHMSKLN